MRERAPFAILFVLIAFVLGVISIFLPKGSTGDGSGAIASSIESPIVQVTEAATPRSTLLVIGVDDLGKESPELRALWMVSFRPPERDVLLLGVPIDQTSEDGDSKLQETFGLTAEKQASEAFLRTMLDILPVQPNVVIVMDEVFFGALVDYLGGAFVYEGHLDGTSVIALQNVLAEDAEALLVMQAKVLKALAFNISLLESTPDIEPLLALIPTHCKPSVDPAQLVLLISPLLPLQPETIRVETLSS